jgi:hypothetical protein
MQCSECQRDIETDRRDDVVTCSGRCRQARFRRLHRPPAAPMRCSFCDSPTDRDNILLVYDRDRLDVCICEGCIVEFALQLAADGRGHARALMSLLPAALRQSEP